MPVRQFLKVNGINLSYLDFQGKGNVLLALHGHFGCGRMFAKLACALKDRWRVIAPDQRGHGWSDKPVEYSREAYIQDIYEFMKSLDIKKAVIAGHSLGGQNAYQFAARYPGMVSALIVEDIGAEVDFPVYKPEWPVRFDTLREVFNYFKPLGLVDDPYFLESIFEYPDGWGLRFDYKKMETSQQQLIGNYWKDWLSTTCPTLLLHGHKSWVLKTGHAREMASRRPNTKLMEFPDCGHTIHDDAPERFNKAVSDFLELVC